MIVLLSLRSAFFGFLVPGRRRRLSGDMGVVAEISETSVEMLNAGAHALEGRNTSERVAVAVRTHRSPAIIGFLCLFCLSQVVSEDGVGFSPGRTHADFPCCNRIRLSPLLSRTGRALAERIVSSKGFISCRI